MLDFICVVFAGSEQRSVSENFKMIMYASAGNLTRDPLLSACPSNHSAIGRDIDMLLELLQYFLIKRYYKNYISCARDI